MSDPLAQRMIPCRHHEGAGFPPFNLIRLNGKPENIEYVCPFCNNTGLISEPTEQWANRLLRKCRRQQRWLKFWNALAKKWRRIARWLANPRHNCKEEDCLSCEAMLTECCITARLFAAEKVSE